MRVVIKRSREEASRFLADLVRDRIVAFKPTTARPFVLGLPTGSSPELVYKHLVDYCHAGQLSFKNVVTFNMDEYVGIPRDHPQSYHSFMFRHLFSQVDIDPKNVHILDGNASDLRAECESYEHQIRVNGGIDLFLGGIGADGHLAFNEPGSSLASRTRIKSLTEDTIAANARFFNNDPTKVPHMALTVGVGTVMDAREVAIIATGAAKSMAVKMVIEGGVSHMWTASKLQEHPRGIMVLDEPATDDLAVKTVNYFSQIERVTAKL